MSDSCNRTPSAAQYRLLAERFTSLAASATASDREHYLELAEQHRKLADARLPDNETRPGQAFFGKRQPSA